MASMIRVTIPYQLQILAETTAEVVLEVEETATLRCVFDELERRYPMLKGAIFDHESRKRRPLIRFFVCNRDVSHEPLDTPLPDSVLRGEEPVLIVGAIAGG